MNKKTTIDAALLQQIKNRIGAEYVLEQAPMSERTSMEVGGPAAYVFLPGSAEETAFLIKTLQAADFPYYIKGNGSNLIVHDEGYAGAIIEMMRMNRITVEGTCLKAECGAMLKEIARIACDASLSGFAFACGIPGSLGGAITMNAGAYDGEMKDIVTEVTLLDEAGNLMVKTCEEMNFSYRHSICSEENVAVLSATFALQEGDRETISQEMAELQRRREEKQPLDYPSCGSTFKRPEGYFAGKLITDAGLRGFSIGGAAVSEKHAGFVINQNHATASDVLALIAHIQEEVEKQFGVSLQCEVKII